MGILFTPAVAVWAYNYVVALASCKPPVSPSLA